MSLTAENDVPFGRVINTRFVFDSWDSHAIEEILEQQWGGKRMIAEPVKLVMVVAIKRPPRTRLRFPRGEPRTDTLYGRVRRALAWHGVVAPDDIVDHRVLKVWGAMDLITVDITRP